jgi:DNA-binding NtrC family response regulator
MAVERGVAAVVADQGVDAVTSFVAKTRASNEALKSANILKSLKVNALIEGDSGVGKLTLARYILPQAPIVTFDDREQLEHLFSSHSDLIIKDVDKFVNISIFETLLHKKSTRLIATTSKTIPESIVQNYFSLKIFIPPLQEREEDIVALAEKFLTEANELFNDTQKIDFKEVELDIADNAHSLKRSVYLEVLSGRMNDHEIIKIVENYLEPKLGGGNDYREYLYLFDVPIIRMALKKFGSQLQVSGKLGLNRNTLRKKITELKSFF